MKLKVEDGLYVDSKTIIRIEWRKFYPVLILADKYENYIKWILRVLAIVGIATSLISINKWYFNLGIALLIFAIEQFFERIIFEYTTIVVQEYPDFEIQTELWKSNGFMMTAERDDVNLPYIGPAYSDSDYSKKFFKYLKNWCDNKDFDDENKIVLSFILEEGNYYTTYLYANPERKNVKHLFDFLGIINRFEKFNKSQQKLLIQLMFWNKLPINDGYSIKVFLDRYKPGDKFYLTPFLVENGVNVKEVYAKLAILKDTYKIKKRIELTPSDIEYHHV